MKKTDKLKHLEMPNKNINNEYVWYEKRMQPKINFQTDELKSFYQQHYSEIVDMLEKEAWNYLTDIEAWNGIPGEDFPCADEMTGEWYLGEISLQQVDGQINGVIEMRFLEQYILENRHMSVQDYLGMEAYFNYDYIRNSFILDCFNTDSI